ncbi:MAG: HAMP domain-containing protein [Bdellovibrionaceae bacterium]|nr:HAMP domain-containing protein [Pseudobdellovibrionaceae bacterium]
MKSSIKARPVPSKKMPKEMWDGSESPDLSTRSVKEQLKQLLFTVKAMRGGDFSVRMPIGQDGIVAEIGEVLNDIIDLNENMADEFLRVRNIVGQEGKMTERVSIGPVKGAWGTSVDSVNHLITDLVQPTTEMARVITSVAQGDLSQKMSHQIDGRAVKGEFLRIGTTVNSMVDQLNSFASEVTRVAKEVGTEGKLGGQAEVKGASGIWKDLTDNVNGLASNLTNQVRNIAKVTTAVANGDLSQKITVDAKGEIFELKNTINVMVDQLNLFAAEVTRVAKEVGTEGKLGGQADVKGVSGTWKDLTDNVNGLASNLTNQVRNIAKVTTAVANGDLSQKITVSAMGEILELKDTINTMVDQLNSFAAEVTRVAKEVGTEGKLGGQAMVKGVSGTWKDLTDNVNIMASNLTSQVRGIVKVVTAVAEGDLNQKFVLEAKGEVAALAETINSMTDTLRTFADQVTTVAREVGIEGKLGGQAKVPGASGTWKDLTDNVNQLAGNLTTQVRAIAEVSTAVTKGDLTRQITVDAQGEVAALKDNINQMIGNLKDTTQKNTEQDWLKTNLAKFSGMMQGQRSITSVAQLIMSELTPLVDAHQGAFFMLESDNDVPLLNLIASYAFTERRSVSNRYRLKEGLVGQCAFEKKRILLGSPAENVVTIESALVQVKAVNVIVMPVLFEGELKAVIELASTKPFTQNYINFLDQLMDSIGVILNMISSSMRTEELLQELKRSNAELEAQAKELEDKAKLLEVKNNEVELASRSLEEKAEQLSLISKYKSEFLANMSHELRTPLNSLLILSKTLAENKDGNLTGEQVKYASTVNSAGQDLLALINEILDLSKVEAGKMPVDPKDVRMLSVIDYLEQTFRPVAEHKNLDFVIEKSPEVPIKMFTDENRLQQILKNLLSNAFKFTDKGRVGLSISLAQNRGDYPLDTLNHSKNVLVFSVTDTGIGIPTDKQKLIFEAFQQADGTTSRKYGGTGLGLTISREIARLLGGIIEVESVPGQGSTFRLFLPQKYIGSDGFIADRRSETEPIRAMPLPLNADFTGRKVLIVDDDMRNIFALSTVLKAHGMQVIYAENGRQGLKVLSENEDTDLVLMDTMMPEMDGLEAIGRIREMSEFLNLPIISLTAKAMKGDREKCLAAGASDYVTKPVDESKLLAVMHQWLEQKQQEEAT